MSDVNKMSGIWFHDSSTCTGGPPADQWIAMDDIADAITPMAQSN